MTDGTIKILTELSTKGLKSGLSAATKMIAGAAASLAALGTAAIKTGIDWESAFAGVKKTVDATDEELNALSDGLRDLSHEIPTTASGLAEIAEAAGQLGIKTENILGFTETMANLGVATNLSATEAASSLAKFANITGMSQTNFDRLGATIVALGNNLATTEADIVSMSMRIAGAGNQVGMSEAQIMSFAGALSSVGIEAEAGGTTLSTLISKMSLATAKGSKELNQFASVAGMSASEFKEAFEKDATGAISAFIQGLSEINENGGSAIGTLDEMGLSDIRMRDALLRAAGASDVFTEAIELGTSAWEDNTALAKEAAQRYDTVESKIQLLKNGARDLGIELYSSVQEPIKKIVTQGTKYLNKLTEAFKKTGFSGMAKELGDVLADITTKITKFAPKLVNAATQMIKGLLDGIKQNASKITAGAVEAGLTLINGILSVLPDIIDTGLQLISGLLKGFADALPTLIPQVVETLVDAIISVVTNLDSLLEAGGKIVLGLLQGIINAVPVLLEGFGEILRNLFGMVSEAEVEITESLGNVQSAYADLTSSIADMKEGIAESNGEIDSACTIAEPWIDRLAELESKSSLTADEQAEWNRLLGKLKTTIPEVSDLINDQTGEIDGGTKALKDYILEWKNYAKAKVYAEMAEEGVRSLIEAEEALSGAKEDYANAEKAYTDAISESNDLIAEMTAKYPELATYNGEGVKSLYDLRMAISEFNLAMGENGEEVYAYEQRAIELGNIIDGLGGNFMDLDIPVSELGGVMEEHRTTVANLQAAYDEAEAAVDHYYSKSQELTSAGDEIANSFELSTGKIVKSKDEYIDALDEMYGNTKDSTLKTALELASMGEEADKNTKDAAADILKNFSGLPSNLQESGKDILLGLIGGMTDQIPGLESASEMSANEIVDVLKETLGIHSPSTVAKEIGKNTIDGLKNGISDNTKDIVTEAKNAGTQLANGLKNGLNGQVSSLTSAAKSIASSILGTFRKTFNIHSPSKETQTIGEYVSEGLASGINSRKKSVKKAAEEVAETATKSIQKAEKSYRESLKNLRESNQEDLEKLRDDHKNTLAKIQEDYEKSLDNIQKSQDKMATGIVDFAGLFDAPKAEKDVLSAEDILKNAKAQTEQVKSFAETIEALRKRGLSQALIDELVDLGPESAEQLKAFNAMTDEQLAEYLKLREERQKQADALAKTQYEDERAKAKLAMEQEILDAKADYEQEKIELKKQYQKDLSELKTDLEEKLSEVGEAMKDGLVKGAKMSEKEAKKVADNLTKGIVQKVKKELGIASPSKVFAQIGMYSSQGLGVGFTKTLPSIMQKIGRSIETEFAKLPTGAVTFQNKYTGAAARDNNSGATYNITNNVESPVPITVAESAREANRQTENTLFKLGVYGT